MASPRTEIPCLDHSTLGKLRGIQTESESVIQFRGIPYAYVPQRWSDPVLHEGLLSTTMFDATRYGPACPQGDEGFQADLRLIGEVELPKPNLTYSEFGCLNVVITTPRGLEPTSRLPVVVWVHGGGFSIGSNAWPQYNMTKLVEQSLTENRPVIGVSINYRLGIFGFLASGVHGLRGNYGLKDLVCGFEWIKRHIEGFGGDPLAVTAVGESAGAICLSTLLTQRHSLFSRCVLMSGDITLRRPRTMEWQERMFQKTIGHLHMAEIESYDVMQRLKALSADTIAQLLPLTDHWSPCLDGQFLNDADTAKLGIRSTWCKNILMGDMGDDGTILRSRYLDCRNAIDRTLQACKDVLTAEETDSIWRAYALDDPAKQDTGLLRLASELRFHLPVLNTRAQLAACGDTRVSTYHIHQANPFPGINRGLASHELDVMYMLHNFDDYLSAADVEFGNKVSGLLLQFTNEQDDGTICPMMTLAMGPDYEVKRLDTRKYDIKYRNGRGRMLLEIGAKRCLLLGEFLQGIPFLNLYS